MQILAAAMLAEACGSLCDHAAPFQQVFVEFVKVPQLQFIDSMVGFQLLHRDRARSANCAEDDSC